MAQVVKVDVDGLVAGGDRIRELAADLSDRHRQSMIGLSDAEPGWVGSSADALVRMSTVWQRIADGHHVALTRHADRVVEAAEVFREAECAHVEAFRRYRTPDGAGRD
ncbi:WXG100 family type VII secretion target [[Mycobacterium] wendilense]|uniref:WXG100 family type VII secretion target n=1 Tax=[Mycobacterium] wendilense TaxID=3064284 RepID=A0ABM9MIH0_9MYCO|nr:hypothetical protein [Mycolicibacterium sp. MU0050]CAJ1585987.1 hypothetical protein MU0050_004023 [Mycolicibacterium sp. MU0050]